MELQEGLHAALLLMVGAVGLLLDVVRRRLRRVERLLRRLARVASVEVDEEES
jgi:hypothetical protein